MKVGDWMMEINEFYFVDTDFDYGYTNSWMGHKYHYYGLYKKLSDGRRKRFPKEYNSLEGLCCSLEMKVGKEYVKDLTKEEVDEFIIDMIESGKINRRFVNGKQYFDERR